MAYCQTTTNGISKNCIFFATKANFKDAVEAPQRCQLNTIDVFVSHFEEYYN